MLDHDTIEAIRSSESQTDAHLAAVTDALLVGTRVVDRARPLTPTEWARLDGLSANAKAEAHQGTTLPRLLVEALVGSTTWRD